MCHSLSEERYSQIGVVSWGFSPCGKTPGVYSRVTKFIDWIKETTQADNLQFV